MTNKKQQNLEVWMRGPIADIPPLLQPVAHALLQAQEEIHLCMIDFPKEKLWIKRFGLASTAFHLQHIAGVLDRMATYARQEMLNEKQLQELAQEGKENTAISVKELLSKLDAQTMDFILQLRHTDSRELTAARGIGRKQIPTTLIGLLFHAAEHTQRHVGQLLVTVKAIKNNEIIKNTD
ncbi:DinB family protein [Olivibacter sitiensis]|uniref:DinB family protein n=1 Tax=Olivibacter sitiensis TaxID=376470 RepID=UPI000480166A|nr:DinB family protein [Olivibacter sitiensis]